MLLVIQMQLLTTSNKINRTNDIQNKYLTSIQYLSPYRLSGRNVCPNASEGCIHGCLNTSGRGNMNSVQQARIRRTKLLFEDKQAYKEKLYDEISKFIRKSYRQKKKPAIRLNGTSDLDWTVLFPDIFSFDCQFYDYTKSKVRYLKFLDGHLENYHFTFSRGKPEDDEFCLDVLRNGGNVAVVFHNPPEKWKRFRCIDGDKHDLRFLDQKGKVVALKAKGRAKRDKTGFVI